MSSSAGRHGVSPSLAAARCAKCTASAGTSPTRSRSAGNSIGNTASRYHRSSRKRPSRIIVVQILVRRCDDARLHGDGLLAADPLHQPVLQHAQQPHLRLQRQLGHFVEKQRAAVGALEPAAALRHRAGEAAALVAEELRIDQFARDRAAVHANERPARPRRTAVDLACHHLLAAAGFARATAPARRRAPPARRAPSRRAGRSRRRRRLPKCRSGPGD